MALQVKFADRRAPYQFLPSARAPQEQGLFVTILQATLIHTGRCGTAIYQGIACANDETVGEIPVGDLVLKMVVHADFPDAVQALRSEHKIYSTTLEPLQDTVVPHCYGLFEAMTSKGPVSCLVLDHVGEPFGLPLHELDMDARLHLIEQVQRLHDAGLEHGDMLHAEHLLLTPQNTFLIVDFQHARPHRCMWAGNLCEGALPPLEDDHGCSELWSLINKLRIWRPQNLTFFNGFIHEDMVVSADDVLALAARERFYDPRTVFGDMMAAQSLFRYVCAVRDNGMRRPRAYSFYTGE